MLGTCFRAGVFAFNAVQSGATYFQNVSPKNFASVYKVRQVFQAISVGCVLWEIKQLVDVLDRSRFIYRVLAIPQLAPIALALGAFAWMAFACLAVQQINRCFKSSVDITKILSENGISKEDLSQITVKWNNSSYQCFQQGLYVSQLAATAALLFFSSRRFFFALNIGMLSYSLIKTSQWKWIQYERKFKLRDDGFSDGPLSFTYSYTSSLIPHPVSDDKECAVCYDRKPTTYFCSNDSFCDPCIIRSIFGSIANKSTSFLRSLQAKRIRYINEQNHTTRIAYKIALSKDQLPSCPSCRGLPDHNEFNVFVEDRFSLRRNTTSASIQFEYFPEDDESYFKIGISDGQYVPGLPIKGTNSLHLVRFQ